MNVNGIEITGQSISGMGTCLCLPEFNLALDMGICSAEALHLRTVLITHGHADHMAGIIQHAFTRDMMGLSPSRFVVSPCLVEPIHQMLALWGSLQHGEDIKCEVVGLTPGEELNLGKGVSVTAFATDHTVISQGYCLWKTKNKLKPEFMGLEGKEIGRLRIEEGIQVTDEVKTLEIVYTGDTRISTIDKVEFIREARVLITEATFVIKEHFGEFATKRGHTHLFQLAERAELLDRVGALVLTHFSARYSMEQVNEALGVFHGLRSKIFLLNDPLP